jgi:predicted TIM-barrel fold metal-dependent hydrolase
VDKIKWKVDTVIDAHAHYLGLEPKEHFYRILELVNYTRACLLCVPGPQSANHNTYALERKTERPDFFYFFGCMVHDPARIAAGDGKYLVDQIDRLQALNCDGFKMLEGKPATRRSWMPVALDHKYFAPYWERIAELDAPVTCHVSDPIDMWSEKDVHNRYCEIDSQDEFIRQSVAVLERHPKLRINFPHFMYLGPQLDRLAEIFERFPGVMVDLAMGNEFLYYLSDNPQRAREFFIKWSKRILYGTDISDRNALKHAHSKAEVLRLFLETDQSFVNLPEVAMGRQPQPGSNGRVELHGLNLPQDALADVLGLNFQRFAGMKPKPLAAAGTRS